MNRTLKFAAMILAVGSMPMLSACTSADRSASRVNVVPKQVVAPAMVQQVQARLQQLGIYGGNIDGVWGPATEAAVQSYQRSQGMPATGQLDTPTLAALNIDGSNAQAANQPPQQPLPSQPPPQARPAP